MPNHAPSRRAWLALVVGLVVMPGCVTREPSVDAGHDPPPDAFRTFLDAPPPDVWRGDAAAQPDVPWDGDLPDAPDPRGCVTFVPGSLASPCRADGTCEAGLTCGAGITTTVRELDGRVTELELFPDLCTMRCDPDAARPCGACGVCVESVPVGSSRASVLDADGRGVCAQPCWASVLGGAPTCRGGQACDRIARACHAPCTDDGVCLLVPTPFEPEAFARLPEDAPLPLTCGLVTGACSRIHPSTDGRDGFLGDGCKTDFDCQLDHVCYRGSAGGPGTCARFSDCEGRGCGVGAVCVGLDPAVWVCATP